MSSRRSLELALCSVGLLGITTYSGGNNLCQGMWEVYCNNVLAGTINTR